MKKRKHKDKKISKKKFLSKQKRKSDAPKRTDLRGIVVRLYPDDNQSSLMNQLGGCSRLIYNSCLYDKKRAIEEKEAKEEEQLFEYEMGFEFKGEKMPSKKDMPTISDGCGLKEYGKKLTEMKTTEKYKFLNDYNRNILAQAYMNLNTAWSNHYKYPWTFNKPVYKKKVSHRDTFNVPLRAIPGGQSKFGPKMICGNRISICTGLEDIHFKCSIEDEIYLNRHQKDIKSVTVTIDNTGFYYASVLICDKKTYKKCSNNIFSFDLGLKEFLIGKKAKFITDDMGFIVVLDNEDIFTEENKQDSDKFVHIPNEHFSKKQDKKIKHHQRKLARKEVGSKRYEKERKTLAKAMRKPANQRKDFQHKLSTQIVDENQAIFMETLNLIGLQSNHNLAAALQDVAFGQFVRMVEYKALKRERIIMKSDTFFPSSKTCSKCGALYGGLKLSERDWVCPVCGHHHDRDRNAAMMLEKNGVELYNAKILEELNKNIDTTAQ